MKKKIALDNTWTSEYAATRPNAATGEDEAATGLSLTVHFSATDGGAAIHADLSKSMTERTEKPGSYFAEHTGAALRTHLATVTSAWEVVMDGTNVKYSVLREIVAIRRP